MRERRIQHTTMQQTIYHPVVALVKFKEASAAKAQAPASARRKTSHDSSDRGFSRKKTGERPLLMPLPDLLPLRVLMMYVGTSCSLRPPEVRLPMMKWHNEADAAPRSGEALPLAHPAVCLKHAHCLPHTAKSPSSNVSAIKSKTGVENAADWP